MEPHVWKKLDLFKADIYSLGVTLYQVASCLKPNQVNKINESEEEMEAVKHNIHKLKLPLEIKQAILSMMSFNSLNRTTTFSLYNHLRYIMNLFDNAQEMPLQLKCNNSIFSFSLKHDWFVKDFEQGKFKYKKIKA